MIIGIICLIIFIAGFFLLFYGSDNDNILCITLGIVFTIIGLIGIIAFIGINLDTIKEWFKI